jgi:hypothetical protein
MAQAVVDGKAKPRVGDGSDGDGAALGQGIGGAQQVKQVGSGLDQVSRGQQFKVTRPSALANPHLTPMLRLTLPKALNEGQRRGASGR